MALSPLRALRVLTPATAPAPLTPLLALLALTSALSSACAGASAPADVELDASLGQETEAPTDDATADDATADDALADDVTGCGGDSRATGCACEDDSECASRHCLPTRDGGLTCAAPCDGGCPDGLACGPVSRPGGALATLCVDRALNLCAPCDRDADCTRDTASEGARCIARGDSGSFCGVACEADGDCPTGFACVEVEVTGPDDRARQCVLEDLEATCACSGRAVAIGASTACRGAGCEGARRCGDAGLSACTDASGGVCEPTIDVLVTFDAAGGVLTGDATRSVRVGEPYGALPEVTRPGYDHAGWRSAPAGGGVVVTAETLVTTSTDHTLHAAWSGRSYRVSFDSAGGSACADLAVTFGAPYGELCAPTRPGHAFDGWWTAAVEGDAVSATSRVAFAGDHTLHARWTPNRYTVTWAPSGGSPCLGAATGEVTFGAPYGPSPCTTVRPNHTFEGWRTQQTGGVRVTAETRVTTPADHTLHARWEPASIAGWVRLAPGSFTAGAGPSELGRTPSEGQVAVILTRSFWVQRTEVTQGQWKALSGGVNPSVYASCGDACPVERVSWWSALAYANALSLADGRPACYVLPRTRPDGTPCEGTWQEGTLDCGDAMPGVEAAGVLDCAGYRLPTEAEWEYATRAGTTTATYGGDLSAVSGCATLSGAGVFVAATPLADLAWYECNNGASGSPTFGTKPVGGKAPNAWGLQDTLGSVAEWTWDRYSAAGALGGEDPQRIDAGANRVRRGGSWLDSARYTRAATRDGQSPGYRAGLVGLRLVRSIP